MKIKCMKLGHHSSNNFCLYCKKNVLLKDSRYCSKNIVSTTEYTIIPTYNDIKNSLFNVFYPRYYKKYE
jgi:hypothetical protein